MNDAAQQNRQFVPKWAESALTKPKPFDFEELGLLRDFYEQWEALHAIPDEKAMRPKKIEAATKLVEKAHVIRSLRGA